MPTYLVTGSTGFIGKRLVARLLRREDAEIFALVRVTSQQRFDEITRAWLEGIAAARAAADQQADPWDTAD